VVGSRPLVSLLREVEQRKALVIDYLFRSDNNESFQPNHIYDAVYQYLRRGGKALRPAVLLFSCGAVGGEEHTALPAAAMVEVYHTWTLVHDDIIDRDDHRRGLPTVHAEFASRARTELNLTGADAAHYGTNVALLAGDLQQAWAMSLLLELSTRSRLDPYLVIQLGIDMTRWLQPCLVEGQTLDVQFAQKPISELTEDMILSMLSKKTGALYAFAGRTGAIIGLQCTDHPYIDAIGEFCGLCGVAFQIWDDILGLVGDKQKVGKPFGSDIREGKRTLIALKAFAEADAKTRRVLQEILGNRNARRGDIERVIQIFQSLGAIAYAKQIATQYVQSAVKALDTLPNSEYKQLLYAWADYTINREC
jgi:geranylgeranyl diphosphate synthase, type I